MMALTGPSPLRPSISAPSILPQIIDLTISGSPHAPIEIESDDDIIYQPRPASERKRRRMERETASRSGSVRNASITPLDRTTRDSSVEIISHRPFASSSRPAVQTVRSVSPDVVFLHSERRVADRPVSLSASTPTHSGISLPAPTTPSNSTNERQYTPLPLPATRPTLNAVASSSKHPMDSRSQSSQTRPTPPPSQPPTASQPSSLSCDILNSSAAVYNEQLPTPGPSTASDNPEVSPFFSERQPSLDKQGKGKEKERAVFEIADFGVKGKGLRALVDITPGTTIVMEAPFIKFKLRVLTYEIIAILRSLSERRQKLFRSFTGFGHPDKLVSIAENNALPIFPLQDPGSMATDFDYDDEEADREWGGMCENISRVNHSCAPNAGWRWDPPYRMMSLQAYDDIRAGSEITACYLEAGQLYENRQSLLLSQWGITCDCPRCSRSSMEIKHSDDRLATFHRLRATWPEDEDDAEAFRAFARNPFILDNLAQMRGILMQESQIVLMGEVWEMEARVHAAWAHTEQARKAAKLATWYHRITSGKRVARQAAVRCWAEDPEECPDWAVLLKGPGEVK